MKSDGQKKNERILFSSHNERGEFEDINDAVTVSTKLLFGAVSSRRVRLIRIRKFKRFRYFDFCYNMLYVIIYIIWYAMV
jgi:hypothetical protein